MIHCIIGQSDFRESLIYHVGYKGAKALQFKFYEDWAHFNRTHYDLDCSQMNILTDFEVPNDLSSRMVVKKLVQTKGDDINEIFMYQSLESFIDQISTAFAVVSNETKQVSHNTVTWVLSTNLPTKMETVTRYLANKERLKSSKLVIVNLTLRPIPEYAHQRITSISLTELILKYSGFSGVVETPLDFQNAKVVFLDMVRHPMDLMRVDVGFYDFLLNQFGQQGVRFIFITQTLPLEQMNHLCRCSEAVYFLSDETVVTEQNNKLKQWLLSHRSDLAIFDLGGEFNALCANQ